MPARAARGPVTRSWLSVQRELGAPMRVRLAATVGQQLLGRGDRRSWSRRGLRLGLHFGLARRAVPVMPLPLGLEDLLQGHPACIYHVKIEIVSHPWSLVAMRL